MTVTSQDLERIFAACFRAAYRTVLVGGAAEPLYAPATSPDELHRVFYRADYPSSALHETAHWCIAGRRRRRLEDYGYWYEPDGRSADAQRAFEAVEAAPQALESLFAEACGVAFHLSADNLKAGGLPSRRFADAVAARRRRYLDEGLPRRAARFLRALRAFGSPPRVGDPLSDPGDRGPSRGVGPACR